MKDAVATDLVVVGSGPGGYAAAFYAADLGKKVILVESGPRLGGVCLNQGCIPSKALLHVAKVMADAREAKKWGVTFEEPDVDLSALRAWKDSILDKLAGGIAGLGQARGVTTITGRAHFEGHNLLRVETAKGQRFVRYGTAVLAVGSRPAMPAAFDLGNPRIMTSNEALELREVPKNLLVVGGGYIGLELGTVYATLGSQVSLVEALPALLSGADPDLVRPVAQAAQKAFKEVRLGTKVSKMATKGKQIAVTLEGGKASETHLYDQVLVAVGRAPATEDLGLENTRVTLDERGFVQVNARCQTSDPTLYAVGDVAGGLLLAHKATKEARVAVASICGRDVSMERVVIPAVVFTDPEVAWCGLTETEAKAKGVAIEVARFAWAASGRALTLGRPEGLTKLILEPETERVLGVGMVGVNAGDLVSEGVLAVEMGASAEDVRESVHPHPTLSETLMECAEALYGHPLHSLGAKRKREAAPQG